MNAEFFSVTAWDAATAARRGVLRTPHGEVETPVFMPVGTRGAVKTMTPALLDELGARLILGNTYHLLTRPGMDIMRAAGGLHRFMAWPRVILTDSGGFQVYSLAELRNITDRGVAFQSHVDGAKLFIGPEESMRIQQTLGSDIAMAFDECPPSTADRSLIETAVERTLNWADTCWESNRRFNENGVRQRLFAIAQGGTHDDLRARCIDVLLRTEFPGYAIGGLAVGEPVETMYRVTQFCCERLPTDKPRYLMGVGTPEDVLNSVMRGIDMFDCVLPTRNARNGEAFTDSGDLPVKAGRYKDDFRPLQDGCACYTCRTFSRAYLRHLFNVGESLAGQLLTIHNLHFYLALMNDIRAAISGNTLAQFAKAFMEKRSNGAME